MTDIVFAFLVVGFILPIPFIVVCVKLFLSYRKIDSLRSYLKDVESDRREWKNKFESLQDEQ